MIFDHRHINEINDEEIDKLVKERRSERQHLEFKITVKHKDDKDRLEVLRDITSLANGGGGYLIIGIRANKKGIAQKYEPKLVGNTEGIKKAIMNLCQDHISERIDGLEIATREVKGNSLVIVRVPVSQRIPHMVKFNNRTDFYLRYYDGKKAMTLGEIKEMFNKDEVSLRIAKIEALLTESITSKEIEKKRKEIFEKIKAGNFHQLLEMKKGQNLSEVTLKRFVCEVGDNPYFRIAITPTHPKVNLIEVESEDIQKRILDPPGSRRMGWNMELSYYPIERFSLGIRHGKKEFEYLELFENGHMEFWAPLKHHFCWRQSHEEFKKRPRLYPYPVTEYPTTFLRLYRAIIDETNIKKDFLVRLHYRNLKGYILIPGAPGSNEFDFGGTDAKPFETQYLDFTKEISSDFSADKIAYELIKRFYASFELDAKSIPFFDSEKELFNFKK